MLSDWRRKHNDCRDKHAKAKKDEKKDDDDKDDDGKDDKEIDEEPDVDKVEDIDDIGNGKPLYADFVYEDWVLLSLRFELHLLIHAFRKDLDDPDRPSFREQHLSYYYDKYYKKSLSLKNYGV